MNIKLLVLIFILLSLTLLAGAGVNPTINVNPSTTPFIDLSDKSTSGVINDPTDPLLIFGIDFIIGDEDVNTVVLTCTSDETSVVPNNPSNLIITGTGNTRNVKIRPLGVGYATITIRVRDNENKTASYTLDYAASSAVSNPSANNFHTHLSSASTAIALNNDYMFVGDDEINEIRLFHRHQSGSPLTISEVSSFLNLPEPGSPEVDIEASCVSPTNSGRIYWMGSMSNSNAGDPKPNRDRIFATDIAGTGAQAILSTIGHATLKENILEWGDIHGYELSNSATSGMLPKEINGFSMEGLEFAPNNTTLYIGFRSPFVPVTNRTKALICPLLNFETWFNNGSPSGNPTFGAPIELDLGNRGIRSIGKNAGNQYLIIAGAYDATDDFALYQWTGHPGDAPLLLNTLLLGLSPEGLVEVPASLEDGNQIEIVNDFGTRVWYADSEISKDLSDPEFQKFSSTMLVLNGAVTAMDDKEDELKGSNTVLYPNPVSEILHISCLSESRESVVIDIYNVLGVIVKTMVYPMFIGNNQININCSSLPLGPYWISFQGNKFRPKKFIKQ